MGYSHDIYSSLETSFKIFKCQSWERFETQQSNFMVLQMREMKQYLRTKFLKATNLTKLRDH